MVKVFVKWGKEKLQVDLDTEESVEQFRTQLWTLTGVPLERQKIVSKGTVVQDDSDWRKLGIKEGHIFMLMGTAGELPKASEIKTIFLEDLGENVQVSQGPPGLINLGNTCYMNASLQCLRAVPELVQRIKTYSSQNLDINSTMTTSLGRLFSQLDQSHAPINPKDFLQNLRIAYPQFAQKDENQRFRQQDAEECWGEIFHTLIDTLQREKVFEIFGGETVSILKCTESDVEPIKKETEPFLKLNCHINNNISFLLQGIKESMTETLTKKSETLNREALYEKISRISKLPQYLTVHFVRFFWKNDVKLKAKILKPVEYPMTLDVYDVCADDLKEQLNPRRKALADQISSGKKEDKMEISEPISKENDTGHYELKAVLTHRGRAADSGHYVAWVREEKDVWYKYDDDIVSPVSTEEVRKLSAASGDSHMPYLVVYESKKF